MNKKIMLIMLAGFLLVSCKQTKDKPAATETETAEVTGDANGIKHRYSIKTAKVTTKMEMPGGMGTNISVLYFDDHGVKEMRESISQLSFGGKSMNKSTRTIIKDDYIYTWEVGQKTGNKIKLGTHFDPSSVNYKELSEEMKNKFKIKEEGTATVLGKTCKVISYESEGMKGKSYVWENIPMKTEMTIAGKAVTAEVTSFEENVSIPASEFEIPSDVEFAEISLNKPAAHP